jgi:GAF domain-containing protein
MVADHQRPTGPTVAQRLADSELALSLTGDLIQAGTEAEAIDRILGIFTTFCAPVRVCYLQIVDGVPGVVRATVPAPDPASGSDAVRLGAVGRRWELTASSMGFCLKIDDVSGPVGVVEVEGVARPELIEHYVNLGLGLSGVCALAIRNARTYDALQRSLADLQLALSEVRTLRGIIPICASCKRIRDDVGAWSQIEAYVSRRSECQFSHGICPECAARLYPDFASGD